MLAAEFALPWWTTDDVAERAVGALAAPSGEIVACDPLVYLSRATAFVDRVPPGRYPVVLGFLGGDVAFARLVIRSGRVAAWRPGVCVGEDAPADLRDALGYPVDAGVGCFVDVVTRDAMVAEERRWRDHVYAKVETMGISPSDREAWYAAVDKLDAERPDLLQLLESAGLRQGDAALLDVPEVRGNLIAFSSGAGDGAYPSFWGVDADGNPVCLVTDFGLLDVDDADEAEADEED